jgi:hypothetical protein
MGTTESHKIYDDGLILVYASVGAPQRAKTIYNDGTLVSDFQQLVFDAQRKSMKYGKKIGWLRIVAHGSPKSIAIGGTVLSEQTIGNYATNFQTLSRLLTGKAVTELYSCQTGLDNALLLQISKLLRNRAVLAYKEKQSALNLDSFKWVGDAKVCMSQICYTVDDKGRPKQ